MLSAGVVSQSAEGPAGAFDGEHCAQRRSLIGEVLPVPTVKRLERFGVGLRLAFVLPCRAAQDLRAQLALLCRVDPVLDHVSHSDDDLIGHRQLDPQPGDFRSQPPDAPPVRVVFGELNRYLGFEGVDLRRDRVPNGHGIPKKLESLLAFLGNQRIVVSEPLHQPGFRVTQRICLHVCACRRLGHPPSVRRTPGDQVIALSVRMLRPVTAVRHPRRIERLWHFREHLLVVVVCSLRSSPVNLG